MIFIVSPNNIDSFKKISDLTWIYIGTYKGLETTRGILKEKNRRFIGRDIVDIANSIRDNFIDYIGKLSAYQDNKVLWYSSRMASKSVNQTTIFHQYIYRKLLEKLSEEENKDILVVTDDAELLENTERLKPKKVCVLGGYNFRKIRLYNKIKGYREVLVDIVFWFIYQFFKNNGIKKIDIIIHSWVDDRTFSNLPRFTDSYFADLSDFLTKNEYRVARITPLRLNLEDIFRLHRYFRNIIYPLSYLPFKDLIKCVFSRFAVTIDNNRLSGIEDLDILNSLVNQEVLKENVSKGYLGYLLYFYSYKYLCLKISSDTKLIYPFENQPWEKMFNLAFLKFKRIAYQHSIIPNNFLDYRTSRFEDATPLPKVILSAGKRWASFLSAYYNGSIIEIAGALRHSYLFNKQPNEGIDTNRLDHIILALPINIGISIQLQRLFLDFLKRNSLRDYSVKIKPHPHLPESAHLKSDFAVYKNCMFVKDGIGRLLKNCALFVTSASAVSFESVILGVKTLYLMPEEFSTGAEDFIKDYLFIAYEENFAEKAEEALKSSEYRKADIQEYFSPPDYSLFLKYLHER